MDILKYTTKVRKGQHLTAEERHDIEVHLKDGWSTYKIAKHLGRSYNTVKDEIERGTVLLYNGKVKRYKASVGEQVYKAHRQNSAKKYRALETSSFLQYVAVQFKNKGWSLDACFGNALAKGLFPRKEMVCTKTLYNYVDLGLLPLTNLDLPEKLRRNTKAKKVRENRKSLGRSIEERPESVENREEFGHWEFDTIIGKKDENEPCVLVMTERMTRMSLWIKAHHHTAEAISEALQKMLAYFSEQYSSVFKTITADNGSEFADLSLVENGKTKVYFTHPYSSFEKGTVECHNRMFRRFIPKGKSIDDYSADDICFFADSINGLPRKILGYKTPEELFEQELDLIYAA